jgi:hypothetical protein
MTLLLLLGTITGFTTAFAPLMTPPRSSAAAAKVASSTRLFYSSPSDDENDSVEFDVHDLEQARASIEELFKQDATTENALEIPFRESNVLTTGARRQRIMDLVTSLEDSDEAFDELVDLWMNETGDSEAAALKEILAMTALALDSERTVDRN